MPCRYPKAIEIYEDIARQSLNNNLLKYGVKGHLLNAGICQLCKSDVVKINNALERYQVLLIWVLLVRLWRVLLLFSLSHIGMYRNLIQRSREHRSTDF